eukprot:TRINITY_DN8370_c0_g1_i6.p1 TRINITY_DN8370_c0_g1~~TRINITY_DN8370_c0_g1_i6.p1  ORF type:complete len:189 (-),score=18.40 TRINITY_DN8370_c0_g1_i6:652-1218(-)
MPGRSWHDGRMKVREIGRLVEQIRLVNGSAHECMKGLVDVDERVSLVVTKEETVSQILAQVDEHLHQLHDQMKNIPCTCAASQSKSAAKWFDEDFQSETLDSKKPSETLESKRFADLEQLISQQKACVERLEGRFEELESHVRQQSSIWSEKIQQHTSKAQEVHLTDSRIDQQRQRLAGLEKVSRRWP